MTHPSLIARRALLLAPLALMAATPALANNPKKKGKEGEGEEKADPVIKLQSLALPIIANGLLVNYVFVQASITLKPEILLTVFEGKEPMLRDAIVREAHSKPFMRPDSYVALDEARLKASILRETNRLIGPGKVAMVTIIKQTPRNFVPPPPKPGTQAKPAPRVEPVGDSSIVP
jgi:flagellar basal body-associated protein FliL